MYILLLSESKKWRIIWWIESSYSSYVICTAHASFYYKYWALIERESIWEAKHIFPNGQIQCNEPDNNFKMKMSSSNESRKLKSSKKEKKNKEKCRLTMMVNRINKIYNHLFNWALGFPLYILIFHIIFFFRIDVTFYVKQHLHQHQYCSFFHVLVACFINCSI